MSITVHIERLILDGFSPDAQDAAQVRAAVEVELTRLLTAGGLSSAIAAGGDRASLATERSVIPASHAQALGTHIAGAVYSGIGRPLREGAES